MLNLYTLLKFLHVTSDIGIFIGVSVQLLTLAALRRASRVEQARALVELIAKVSPLSAVSATLTIGTGLYMTLTAWGWEVGWTTVALSGIVLFMPPLGMIMEPRLRAILDMVKNASDGPIPTKLDALIRDPFLNTALQTQTALVFGIVFLMTTKPPFLNAILALTIALALGLLSGLPLWMTERRRSKIGL